MKKIIYSDEWGYIVEYTRFRGKRGRYVSDAYGKRLRKGTWIKEETSQWRLSGGKVVKGKLRGGKRVAKIMVSTPSVLMKQTYPGAVADADGMIFEAIRSTNLFTEVHKAQRALINIRGVNEQGEEVKIQSEITIGSRHQSEQLAYAVREMLAGEGYRTNYSLSVVKSQKLLRKVKKLDPLIDMQFTVTLFH